MVGRYFNVECVKKSLPFTETRCSLPSSNRGIFTSLFQEASRLIIIIIISSSSSSSSSIVFPSTIQKQFFCLGFSN